MPERDDTLNPGDGESREERVPRITDAASATPQDERVSELLARSIDVDTLAGAVEEQEAPDAADTLEDLEEDEASEILGQMEDEKAAQALAEMQTPLAVGVLDDLIEDDLPYAARLLELMAPDDAVDLIQAIDDDHRNRVLGVLGSSLAERLVELAAYDRESAGGIMTTDFIALRDDITVGQAIEAIRDLKPADDTNYALVTDETDRLVGLLGLRALLLADNDDEPITAIMEHDVDAIHPDLDREEVARTFDRYDYSVLPVVNDYGQLLGVVTVDDVIDIIREEHTEDVQKTVGAGKGEAVYSTLREKFRGRIPWLLVNLLTSSVAAVVVLQFEELIAEIAILAVLMPVIANQAGNAGQQSLAVTLRGIVLQEVRGERVARLIFREGTVGLVNGIIGGLLVALVLTIITGMVGGASWRLGMVVLISMPVALAVGCLVGCMVPLFMWKIGRDPATASTIFLTMVTDSFSFLVFLGLALTLSGWLGISA